MSEDRLPLYCAHDGVVAMATGDMTRIPPQVVYLTLTKRMHTVCGSIVTFLGWMIEEMRKYSNQICE